MKIDKRIIPLAIGGLGIGTTEFTVMGLLPDIAKNTGNQYSAGRAPDFCLCYGSGNWSTHSNRILCKIST